MVVQRQNTAMIGSVMSTAVSVVGSSRRSGRKPRASDVDMSVELARKDTGGWGRKAKRFLLGAHWDFEYEGAIKS